MGLETGTEPPQQEEAFTAWRRFLERSRAIGPTVLVIEDLHWADEAFVAFLEHLTERTAGLPLLVVVTARPEVEERHPSWPPGRRSTVLSLSPLTDGDVETLVTQSLPEADPELIRDRARACGRLAALRRAARRDAARTGAPDRRGSIGRDVDPRERPGADRRAGSTLFPREPKRVLMEASVVGKTFWSGAVASLGEHPNWKPPWAISSDGSSAARSIPPRWKAMPSSASGTRWSETSPTRSSRRQIVPGCMPDVARWIADRTAGAMGEDAESLSTTSTRRSNSRQPQLELDTEQLSGSACSSTPGRGARLDANRRGRRGSAPGARALLHRRRSRRDTPKLSPYAGRSLLIAGRPADALPLSRACVRGEAARSRIRRGCAARSQPICGIHADRSNREASRMMDGLEEELRGAPSRARAEHLGAMSGGAFTLRGSGASRKPLCGGCLGL